MGEAWIARAHVACESGRLDLAAAECDAGLGGQPPSITHPVRDPVAWHLAAVVAWRCGKIDLASERVEQACALNPAEATYWNTWGAVLRSAGRLAESLSAFERSLSLSPRNAGGWANLAAVRLESGDPDGAEVAARRAIAIDPRDAQGWCNLGNALKFLARSDEAITAYEQALAIAPGFALALANLGGLVGETQDSARAVELLQQALRLDPDSLPAWINLGQTLQTRGDLSLAIRCYGEALARGAGPGIEVRRGLVLPVIPHSVTELETAREQLESALAAWETQPPREIVDPVHEIGVTPFHLAYHARNDVAPLSRMAELYRRIVPGLTASRVSLPSVRDPLRVGFLSRHWHDHSNTRLMAGLVKFWPRVAGDRVILFGFSERNDCWSRWVSRAADECVTLPLQLDSAADRVAAADLDVLIYTDIGMEPLTYFLAHKRLAPVQLTTWGVPETSGLPSIDGFFSSDLIEPEAAASHYREALLRLPLLPSVYPHPEQWRIDGDELSLSETLLSPRDITVISHERRQRGRQRWGYEEVDRLYVCPQSLFKLHPEFDLPLGRILQSDRSARLLLVSGTEARWSELLLARLAVSWSAIGDARELLARVRILPRMRSGEFLDLLAAADVLLDPWHFGGGNTTFEALAYGTPVVTWPGEFLRGRVTLGCYRQMGLADLPVVTTQAAYVETAVSIAQDREGAAALRAKILAKSDRLYLRKDVTTALRAALVSGGTSSLSTAHCLPDE